MVLRLRDSNPVKGRSGIIEANVLYHSLPWVGKPAKGFGAFVRNGDYSLKWIAASKCAPWQFLDPGAFTGTDRGLLRSVLGPWSPVPKCEAPGAPIPVEEHTSMAPRSRKVRILRLKNLPPFRDDPSLQIRRLRYSPGLAPTTRLNALLNAASDS